MEGVAAADQALWARRPSGALVAAGELMAEAAVRTGRGAARARRAAEFATDRADSVRESQSRVLISVLGFPDPELQARFVLSQGREAFTDFFWPDHRHIGEFDGAGKYRDPADAAWPHSGAGAPRREGSRGRAASAGPGLLTMAGTRAPEPADALRHPHAGRPADSTPPTRAGDPRRGAAASVLASSERPRLDSCERVTIRRSARSNLQRSRSTTLSPVHLRRRRAAGSRAPEDPDRSR